MTEEYRSYFPVRSRRAGIPAGPAVLSGSGRSRRAPEKAPDRRPGTDLRAGNRPAGENPGQQAAIAAEDRVTAVVAGPGTGKTYTLVEHVAHMIDIQG